MKMEHLTSMEVASFVDGFSSDRKKVIKHLNKCANCFEQVAFVMNFISDNPELCEEINKSYNKMVSENMVGHYIRKFKKYFRMAHKSLRSPSNERKQVKV